MGLPSNTWEIKPWSFTLMKSLMRHDFGQVSCFFLCHRFPIPTKSSSQKAKRFSVQWAARQRWKQKAPGLQDRMKANLGRAPMQPRGQDNWRLPGQGCRDTPSADFQVKLCVSHRSPHPGGLPARQTLSCKPRHGSAPSSYLQFKTSVFTLWPITEGCFPWKGSITASLLVPTMCPFNFFIFFFSRKVCMLLFSALSPCARGNSCFGTHGKDCRNISCCSKERLLQQKTE